MNNPQDRNKKALGRGIESLLGGTAAGPRLDPRASLVETLIPLDSITTNPYQPRRNFSPAALAELAASIRAQGVLQPILVRPAPGKSGAGTPIYELIAGERRLRAAMQAGLNAIPAIVRTVPDEKLLEVALIENLQREDLNPIEEARGYQQLAAAFKLTQEEIAQRTGKDRATIANAVRLLRLPSEVQQLLAAGALSPGQARPLLALPLERQTPLAQRIVAESWNARRVERFVQQHLAPPAEAIPPHVDANVADAAMQLQQALGTQVSIRARGHRGEIIIVYADLNEFQRLFDRLMKE